MYNGTTLVEIMVDIREEVDGSEVVDGPEEVDWLELPLSLLVEMGTCVSGSVASR